MHGILYKHRRSIHADEMDGCITSVLQSRESASKAEVHFPFRDTQHRLEQPLITRIDEVSPRGMDFKCLFVDIKLASRFDTGESCKSV